MSGRGPARQRWLARASLVLALLCAGVLVASAAIGGWLLAGAVILGAMVEAATVYWFISRRRLTRWLAAALGLLVPILVGWLMVRSQLLWVVIVVIALALLALAAGRAALTQGLPAGTMPEFASPRPRQPFLVMNPRSGGGKVARYGLVEKATALGAEVAVLGVSETTDVEALARAAVARGADLLGVAGGDGTQALVAGIAAEHDLPFMVLSAGTRNHFALDLGLDRHDPASGLAALTDDAVELHVDLGDIGGRVFVNNVSFGVYAEIVQSPSYRDDKARTTLDRLPDLMARDGAPRLVAQAGSLRIEGAQAILVSDNPYGLGDLAGLGRRARLDRGMLGVVAVRVDGARHAMTLIRHVRDRGLTVGEAEQVVVTADRPEIFVGVDGEALSLPTPVAVSIRPQALRVRVPRSRPGVPAPKPTWSWVRLRALAGVHARRSPT